MLNLATKMLKQPFINMFKEIKKSMSRKLNRDMRTMSPPIKNINKETGIIKIS